ncbi:uncharacterized protein LOC120125441 isoform X2 [Hibiscus syriacus]|uniref:uncharacterized protein LOC120125198 isoform X2 n=1 Tax=Hibiscus syriacus TaxID=106335 RepID=UPI0019221841|nr:uncharacterized protein LOC120125198 isoform X2 [Hibiscus syriacus]XP_038999803.1 uncharacterized protein LOC120125441 isoform X2 [Hibiscus syriacus]
MEMLTIFSASRHHNFFTYSISRTLNSDSLQASIFPPKFHPLRHSLPFRLRPNSTTRGPRCISAAPRPPSPPDSDPPDSIETALKAASCGVLMVHLSMEQG